MTNWEYSLKKSKEERIKIRYEEKEKIALLWNNSIPVPDLLLDKEEKEILKSKFIKWSTHFQKTLLNQEVEGLIKKYEDIVFNVETKSCPHTDNGTRRTGRKIFFMLRYII